MLCLFGPVGGVITAWLSSGIGVPGWKVVAPVAGIWLVAVAAATGIGRRIWPATGWLIAGSSVLAVLTGLWAAYWVLPTRMMAEDASATSIARTFLAQPGCRATTIGAVGPLSNPTQVCALGGTGHDREVVEFDRFGTSEGSRYFYGLLYAPHLNRPTEPDLCFQHLYGAWWQYQELILNCPSGWDYNAGP